MSTQARRRQPSVPVHRDRISPHVRSAAMPPLVTRAIEVRYQICFLSHVNKVITGTCCMLVCCWPGKCFVCVCVCLCVACVASSESESLAALPNGHQDLLAHDFERGKLAQIELIGTRSIFSEPLRARFNLCAVHIPDVINAIADSLYVSHGDGSQVQACVPK